MVRHNQVRVPRDDESRDVDTLGAQRVKFGQQDRGVNDHAIANHRCDVGIENARGNELQGEGLAFDDDSVTGVVATLVAHDHIHVTG